MINSVVRKEVLDINIDGAIFIRWEPRKWFSMEANGALFPVFEDFLIEDLEKEYIKFLGISLLRT